MININLFSIQGVDICFLYCIFENNQGQLSLKIKGYKMKDLTIYSNDELSNHVFNDDYFWNEKDDLRYLFDLINEEFHTTKPQRATLLVDLMEYNAEMQGV